MAEFIDLSAIRLDGGTQPRASIDLAMVATYAEDMARGDPFPPPILYFDGADYWLADGFHRVHAARQAGKNGLSCAVRQGTQRDAVLYSVGANADHGLRRTNEDKRRAVMRLLNDPEWARWADREIARHCHVSPPMVAAMRPAEVTKNSYSEPAVERTYTTRHGTVATMRTENIGRRSDPQPAPLLPQTAPQAPPTAPDNTTYHADRFIHARVLAVAAALSELPTPAEAARRYPTILRGEFSADQARDIATWFDAFAAAWEVENGGARHVAAE